MKNTLLATKMMVPIQKDQIIDRLALSVKLNRALERDIKLVLISAPAGYGKTTLVAQWIRGLQKSQQIKHRFCWYSLDIADNDPYIFWMYIFVGIQGLYPEIGRAAIEELATRTENWTTVITLFINDLVIINKPILLVLDDYHVISNPVVHECMSFFFERLHSTTQIAILSRADPPLPLSRLRVRGELLEIRAKDLRFNHQEVEWYLNSYPDLALNAQDIALLDEKTEGWAAGLKLAALAIKETQNPEAFIAKFKGHHHLLMDYLIDEVLRNLPPDVHEFLLATSILEKLNSSLCDAVMMVVQKVVANSAHGSAEKIAYLEQANLFLFPLDSDRQWFRYHALFRDLLAARLKERNPNLIPMLHEAASRWYERHQFALEAAQHALATSDVSFASGTIQRLLVNFHNWGSGFYSTALMWLKALPPEIFEENLELGVYSSVVLFASGMMSAGRILLSRIERSVQQLDRQSHKMEYVRAYIQAVEALYFNVFGENRQAIQRAEAALGYLSENMGTPYYCGRMALGRAEIHQGNVQEAIAIHRQTFEQARRSGNLYLSVNLAFLLAEALLSAGRLCDGLETCLNALGLCGAETPHNPIYCTIELTIAKIHYERNEIAQAWDHLQVAQEFCQRGGMTDDFGAGRALRAEIFLAKGDVESARTFLIDVINYTKNENNPRLTTIYEAQLARFFLRTGEITEASKWANRYSPDIRPEWENDYERLTVCQVWIQIENLKAADDLLREVGEATEKGGRNRSLIEALILRSILLNSLGDLIEAKKIMARSLSYAHIEGYTRVYLDLGVSVIPILSRLEESDVSTNAELEFRDRLLLQFHFEEETRKGGKATSGLIEPLTERELEVLRLLLQGATNMEMAEALVISLGTVKSHLSHIMGKLGTKNRTQTILFAQSERLIKD